MAQITVPFTQKLQSIVELMNVDGKCILLFIFWHSITSSQIFINHFLRISRGVCLSISLELIWQPPPPRHKKKTWKIIARMRQNTATLNVGTGRSVSLYFVHRRPILGSRTDSSGSIPEFCRRGRVNIITIHIIIYMGKGSYCSRSIQNSGTR